MLANTFAGKPLARLLVQALGGVSLWAGLSGMAWSMDFQQAYEAAVDNDATIRASRAGTAASRERLPQARAQLRPNVSLNAGRNYNDLTSEGRNMLGQLSRSET